MAGAVSVTVSGWPSASDSTRVPLALAAFVLSGAPSASALPAPRPSSDRHNAADPTTGVKFVPLTVIASTAPAVAPWSSVTV